jgi:dephospho-CoA kinase
VSTKRPGSNVFALTGGIGSGKSTVAGFLRQAGVPVVDADALARQVVAPGSLGLAAVVAHFGPSILQADGSLDRQRLGSIVFSSPEARTALEALLHPLIQGAAEQEFQRQEEAGQSLICYEIPLLFETEQEDRYRPVVVVHVPEAAQLARVMARDGIDEEEAQRRISAQIPLDHKAEQADHVIENTGTLEETRAQTLAVLQKIYDRTR